ncbi:MAG: SMP-30/gluconolactonase/LRE family protein [Actinomycetes bacterium]
MVFPWKPVNPTCDVAVDARAELGERPVWDDRDRALVWVDIPRGQLRRYSPDSGTDTLVKQVDGSVGCVALREGGGLLIGADRQVQLLDNSGALDGVIHTPGADDALFNDGAVDPGGRFVGGTSTAATRPGGGALYSFSPDGEVRILVDSVTESNGVGWSPDGTTMYYVDSGETYFGSATSTAVRTYDYDVDSGSAVRVRDLAVLTEDEGIPDGLVVDAEGAIWLAVWGGSELRRYAPDGTLLDRVPVPASQVTCPGFGGDDLSDLYVTTAHQGLDEVARAVEPLAGNIFHLTPGVSGLPATRYRG